MTKFEQVGVSYQEDSASKYESSRSFRRSCSVCCTRGLRLDCDRCAIAHAYGMVQAAFDTLAAGPALSPA